MDDDWVRSDREADRWFRSALAWFWLLARGWDDHVGFRHEDIVWEDQPARDAAAVAALIADVFKEE